MSTVSITDEEVAVAPRRPRSTIVLGEESVLAPKAGIEIGLLSGDSLTSTAIHHVAEKGDEAALRLMSDVAESSLIRARMFSKSTIAWTQAGFACLTARRLPEAQDAFRHAIELDPAARNSRLGLARTLFELGNTASAEQHLRSLLHEHPGDTEILVSLGVVLAGDNRLEEALALLDSAKIAERDEASFFAMRGGLRVALGHYQAAVGDLRKAVRRRPDWVHVRNSLGVAEVKSGQTDKAERQFLEALRIAPLYEESFVNLLRLKFSQRQFSAILDSASEQYRRGRAPANVARIVAASAFELEKWRVAQWWLEGALAQTSEINIRARLLNDLGVVHSRMDDQAVAGDYFERSLQEYATELAFVNRGKTYLLSNNPDLAIKWLTSGAYAFGLGQVERRKLLTNAYGRVGDIDNALREGRSLVREKLADRGVFISLTNVLSDLACDYSASASIGEQGLREFPDDPGLINNVAYSLLMNGEVDRAAEYLEHAKAMHLESMFLSATQGLLALKRGQLSAGRELYERALAMAGTDAMRERVRTKRDLEEARAILAQGGSEKEAIVLFSRASSGGAEASPYAEQAQQEMRRLRSG